jgi:hypothetical protein
MEALVRTHAWSRSFDSLFGLSGRRGRRALDALEAVVDGVDAKSRGARCIQDSGIDKQLSSSRGKKAAGVVLAASTISRNFEMSHTWMQAQRDAFIVSI